MVCRFGSLIGLPPMGSNLPLDNGHIVRGEYRTCCSWGYWKNERKEKEIASCDIKCCKML